MRTLKLEYKLLRGPRAPLAVQAPGSCGESGDTLQTDGPRHHPHHPPPPLTRRHGRRLWIHQVSALTTSLTFFISQVYAM